MKNLESNKIIASILLSGLIAMLCSFFTDLFYAPEHNTEKRGYQVEIADNTNEQTSEEAPTEIVLADILKTADITRGKSLSKKCAACHSFEKGGPNKVGPNLWDIVGHKVAAREGYAYSGALTSLEGNWNYEALYEFLKSPKDFTPGTKMSFAGFKKPEDIAAMIEFLRNNSEKPLPLPN